MGDKEVWLALVVGAVGMLIFGFAMFGVSTHEWLVLLCYVFSGAIPSGITYWLLGGKNDSIQDFLAITFGATVLNFAFCSILIISATSVFGRPPWW